MNTLNYGLERDCLRRLESFYLRNDSRTDYKNFSYSGTGKGSAVLGRGTDCVRMFIQAKEF